MKQYKAYLFDGDGVLIRPPRLFSEVYEERHGLRSGSLQPFYDESFQQAIVGKADLKELIERRRDLWCGDEDVQTLLKDWFTAESYVDDRLVSLIQKIKSQGALVCLATNQERYRAAYVKDVMVPSLFDKYFFSSRLGVSKDEPKFFEIVLSELQKDRPGLLPGNILLIDDRQKFLDAAAQTGMATLLYSDSSQVQHILLESEDTDD